MERAIRATKQLGEADDAEDDLTAWVTKSRDIELKRETRGEAQGGGTRA